MVLEIFLSMDGIEAADGRRIDENTIEEFGRIDYVPGWEKIASEADFYFMGGNGKVYLYINE